MENNLTAQILHQSCKTPVPAPVHTASGRLGLAPLSSALTNKPVNKQSHLHSLKCHRYHTHFNSVRAGQSINFKTKLTSKKVKMVYFGSRISQSATLLQDTT